MTDVRIAPSASQAPAGAEVVDSHHKYSSTKRRERRAGLVFVLPFVVLFVVLFLAPLIYALYISMYREQLVGGTVFVGLENYRQALKDSALWLGVLRTLRYGLLQVPIMLGLALLAALALDSGKLRFSRLFRVGIFLPFAVPSVIAALMWGYLYGNTFGPFAQIAGWFGAKGPNFLGTNFMLSSLANVAVWEWTGYNAIIMYAALRAISPDLYEAAAIDGAGAIRTAWSIKIPAIRPALLLTLVFSVIGTMQLFNEPSIFRPLAPDVIVQTYTPNLYAYSLAFTNAQYGYSAAISFTLGMLTVVLSYVAIMITSRRSSS